MTATLSSAVATDETVELAYAVPSANPLEDAAGNDVAAFSGEEFTNSKFTPPTVTIAGGPAVIEGTVATFTVTASAAPSADLRVSLTVSEAAGNDYVAATAEGEKTVVIAANATDAEYTVPTVADSAREDDGTVTVQVEADPKYKVGRASSARRDGERRRLGDGPDGHHRARRGDGDRGRGCGVHGDVERCGAGRRADGEPDGVGVVGVGVVAQRLTWTPRRKRARRR